MLKELHGGQKVDSAIKPLPFKKRKAPVLNVGQEYFVSFLNNNAYPCTLLKVINEFDKTEVEIEVTMNPKAKKGYIDSKGVRSAHAKIPHILYATQIGLTPDDAVRNQA